MKERERERASTTKKSYVVHLTLERVLRYHRVQRQCVCVHCVLFGNDTITGEAHRKKTRFKEIKNKRKKKHEQFQNKRQTIPLFR